MRIVFRVDASLEMGSGHVMRCLTLADALRIRGAECRFVCRQHAGNMINNINQKGYKVHVLPLSGVLSKFDKDSEYATWLGAIGEVDASETLHIVQGLNATPDWLVLDHYTIGESWQQRLRPYCQKIMVIDDLANRRHDCDLLLDQTFSRREEEYGELTPADCLCLTGTSYALLRPEFAEMREFSLARRREPELKQLLITLGGVDKKNVVSEILDALQYAEMPDHLRLIIVIGFNAPWLKQVKERAAQLKWPCDVLTNVENMAQLMTDSDLCIGAAGSTTWERCCLGLPSLMIKLAENQEKTIDVLSSAGTVLRFENPVDLVNAISAKVSKKLLRTLSLQSMQICDGDGTRKVIDCMSNLA